MDIDNNEAANEICDEEVIGMVYRTIASIWGKRFYKEYYYLKD